MTGKAHITHLALILASVALASRINWNQPAEQERIRCKSNLKAIGTATEMYASDSDGRYPTSLARLLPGYLTELPVCPTTGLNYSETYHATAHPDSFSLGCRGRHHGQPHPEEGIHGEVGDFSQGYPWYDAEFGLIGHP